MRKSPRIIKPEAYGPALNVVGTSVTLLASRQETNGQEFTYQAGEAGTGPPPHSHPWDEAFFVVKGSVEITCDGTTQRCPPGSFAFVPGGTVHSFQYGPDGGEMLEITGSGSMAAQLFTAIDAQIAPGPPAVEKVVKVMKENGVTVLPHP